MIATEQTPSAAPLPAVARRGIAAVCAALGAVLLVASGRYGYHRDELYFLACGHHPAWSYPDQGALTPMLASAFEWLGRGSLVVFRLPAVASVVTVAAMAGLTARELGGRARAQVLATLTVAVGTVALLSGHLLVTSTPDLAVWVSVTWVVLRITRTGRTRLWLPAGGLVAVGLLNKDLVLVLVLSLTLGVLAVPGGRALVVNRWYALGALLAVAAWVPGLVWQAEHDWPQLTVARLIEAEYGTPDQRIGFLVLQLVDRYGPEVGLPAAYSGLNAFGLWGPPPASAGPVVLVWEDRRPPEYLRGCHLPRRVGGPVPNEERDEARIFRCAGPRGTWSSIWPQVAHLSNSPAAAGWSPTAPSGSSRWPCSSRQCGRLGPEGLRLAAGG